MLPETRLPLNSFSPNAARLAELKTLFPEAFLEGKIDFDRLKQALGEAVQTDRERYGLNWAGKTNAIHTLQSLSVGTLKPDRDESVNFDTTENLIIEGDNLEVLKLLQKSYFGKVKMIYIDPPYNTGNEFIYPDNFREGLGDYLKYSGQVSAEGAATTSNKETDGRYHSKWLSMMYPRLFLAKNLLRDDGVIFISIDDHEVHNLRLLMNEIFGEENFVANIVWQKRTSPDARATIGAAHDSVVLYARDLDVFKDTRIALPLSEEQRQVYKNIDNDPRGEWVSVDLTAQIGHATASQFYEIETPHGQLVVPPAGRCWGLAESTFKSLLADKRIWFGSDGSARPRLKRYLSEAEGVAVWTWWTNKEAGHNQEGKQQLNDLLGAGEVFDTPKPARLIRRMLQIATTPQTDDIVVDFFAGSGTTAQAVLELNKEDGGNRKFILVQLPESTQNKQLPTIAAITRERVKRVIAKMNEADTGKLDVADSAGQDRGFKAFRLAASNFKIWEDEGGEADADAVAAQLELFADNLLPDAASEDILFEILIKAGYDLNVPREEITIAGQSVDAIAGGDLLVCLERDIRRETLAGMMGRKPQGVICLDEAFHGDDALLTNTLLQMQDAGIRFHTV